MTNTEITSGSQAIFAGDSSLLANILSFISPWDLRNPLGAQLFRKKDSIIGTSKNFQKAAELALNIFLRTAQNQGNDYGSSLGSSRLFSRYVVGKNLTNVQMLIKMERIRSLGLREEDFPENGNETIESLLLSRSFATLQRLTLVFEYYGPKITANTVSAIALQCPNLSFLSIYVRDRDIEETGLDALRGMKLLENISFHKCTSLTDRALEAVSLIPGITSVHLADCEKVKAVGIEMLLKNAPKLCEINLAGSCAGATRSWSNTGAVAGALATHGKNLTSIEMCGSGYNNAEILTIVQGCTKLTYLGLRGISDVYLKHLEVLRAQISNLNAGLKVSLPERDQ